MHNCGQFSLYKSQSIWNYERVDPVHILLTTSQRTIAGHGKSILCMHINQAAYGESRPNIRKKMNKKDVSDTNVKVMRLRWLLESDNYLINVVL